MALERKESDYSVDLTIKGAGEIRGSWKLAHYGEADDEDWGEDRWCIELTEEQARKLMGTG